MFLFYLSAQELASQDEKLLLMESSLKATQEQLTEQIAETVRQEQNSRKPQAELKTVTEGIIASEEEKMITKSSILPCYFTTRAKKEEENEVGQYFEARLKYLTKFLNSGTDFNEGNLIYMAKKDNQKIALIEVELRDMIVSLTNKREKNTIFADGQEKSCVETFYLKILQDMPSIEVPLAVEIMNSLTCLL
ncbi:Tubby-Related Protein 4 [Manis pentadactyla]|nr:Tubby-Related Protein 4 [Manis pentadactyla]